MAYQLEYLRWTPVTDGLPVLDGWYPVSGTRGFWTLAYWQTATQRWSPLTGLNVTNILPFQSDNNAVTAWANLPRGYIP